MATVTRRRTKEFNPKKGKQNEIKLLERLERENKLNPGQKRRLNMLRRFQH